MARIPPRSGAQVRRGNPHDSPPKFYPCAVHAALNRQTNVARRVTATCAFRGRFRSKLSGLERLSNLNGVKRPAFFGLVKFITKNLYYTFCPEKQHLAAQRNHTDTLSNRIKLSCSFPAIPFRPVTFWACVQSRKARSGGCENPFAPFIRTRNTCARCLTGVRSSRRDNVCRIKISAPGKRF